MYIHQAVIATYKATMNLKEKQMYVCIYTLLRQKMEYLLLSSHAPLGRCCDSTCGRVWRQCGFVHG